MVEWTKGAETVSIIRRSCSWMRNNITISNENTFSDSVIERKKKREREGDSSHRRWPVKRKLKCKVKSKVR